MAGQSMKGIELYVQPPRELFEPLKIPARTLMGPGPSNCSPRVLRALGNQVLGHLHPETCQVNEPLCAGIVSENYIQRYINSFNCRAQHYIKK